jgi:hypothetical protein
MSGSVAIFWRRTQGRGDGELAAAGAAWDQLRLFRNKQQGNLFHEFRQARKRISSLMIIIDKNVI